MGDAWSLLGAYGAFGGRGTHNARPLEFDEATDTAILRADMGETDPDIARPTLVRALEGLQRGGPPI